MIPVADLACVSANFLKGNFREAARRASKEPVAITLHQRRRFVILSAAMYEELRQTRRASLEGIAAELDDRTAKMNTPKARRAATRLFSATPFKLGKAAKRAGGT